MRVPLSWLRDYVAVDVDPTDDGAVSGLARVLDGLGLVVEGVEKVGAGLEGVRLAAVTAIAPIKGADKIRLATVDAGEGAVEVVCGAWNFEVGDVVPYAPPGTTLANGMTIAARTMRGVRSDGMLCSARELGLGDDHAGLMVLGRVPDVEVGTPIAAALGISADVVFDLAVEPNRPDALSIVGVARDVAARLGVAFTAPSPAPHAHDALGAHATVEVLDADLCPRLVAAVVRGVADIPSPPEVRRRLALAGMRPISAVVDSSNYVMLELGQPTHPYDLRRLGGHGLRVRRARPGERLTTLDGVERVLGEVTDDLLICDATDAPVGLAGIMGGASSEIAPDTTDVLLEVASFASLGVGRTSAAQGLRTEASTRFWRGTDPEGLDAAAARFCELVVAAHAAAGRREPVVDPGFIESAPAPSTRRTIGLRPARANAYLGTSLAPGEIADLLRPLGFVVSDADDALAVEVPGFRSDVAREVDLIEEVARHFGYDRVRPTLRRSPFVGRRTPRQELRRALRATCTGFGALEAWTSSITDPAREVVAHAAPVALANPIAVAEVALRTHLGAGLLGALRHNEGHRNAEIRLFEIGNVFRRTPGDERPDERELCALVLAGPGDDATTAWSCWHALRTALSLDPDQFAIEQAEPGGMLEADALSAGAHPTRSARLRVGSAACAVVGEIDPAWRDRLGLASRRIGWLVVDVGVLEQAARRSGAAVAVSRFPSADIDLSFVLPDAVPASELAGRLRLAAGVLAESVSLVDTYRGPSVAAGSRSLTYRIRFVAPDRTLGEDEIAAARASVIADVESHLPAALRA